MYRHASDPEFPQVSSNYKAISGYSASNTRRFLSRYVSQESRYNSFRTEISEQWSYILFRASKTTLTESGKFVTHCCGSSTNHLFRLQFNPAILMFLQFNVTKKSILDHRIRPVFGMLPFGLTRATTVSGFLVKEPRALMYAKKHHIFAYLDDLSLWRYTLAQPKHTVKGAFVPK